MSHIRHLVLQPLHGNILRLPRLEQLLFQTRVPLIIAEFPENIRQHSNSIRQVEMTF